MSLILLRPMICIWRFGGKKTEKLQPGKTDGRREKKAIDIKS
jgi:hypothetical protein